MTTSTDALPIEEVLPRLLAALHASSSVVLRAPPGAGKTTRVPLALLDQRWLGEQRILMLEPRRLAARAAASRMAATRRERVGDTVGYRMRGDTKVSAATRIEVVTEGVLTRMLQQDPALEGIALVIFDEFHERSVHADLGLALTLQSRALLRPDLRILIMSATLDTDPVAALLGDAAIITSEGRAWPVDTVYLTHPVDGFVDTATARAAANAVTSHDGDVLVFLPGAAEIRRAESVLRDLIANNVDVYPLFGQLPQDVQDRALAPSPTGRRKIVLATSIAETSLTIEGVRVVVDSGMMRVPRFSPRTGMGRLETVRTTRAAADQRRGRAGRTAPGVCYRMWTQHEDAGLVPHRAPEILETDLTPLALELAAWGVSDPTELQWLDQPPRAAYAHARELLLSLHATYGTGAITTHGREINQLGLHPRLAHMLVRGAEAGLAIAACDVAALLGERDIMRAEHARDPDLRLRMDALRNRGDHRADAGAADRVRRESAALRGQLQQTSVAQPHQAPAPISHSWAAGLLIAFAYPDRIAQQRATGSLRFLLRNGRGAAADSAGSLSNSEFIAIAALEDSGREARIFMAAPLEREDLELHFADDIITTTTVEWDDATESVRALRTRALGALILEQVRINAPENTDMAALLLDAIARKGIAALPWNDETRGLVQRIEFARSREPDRWPDLSDATLLRALDIWLLPFVPEAKRLSDIGAGSVAHALRAILDRDQLRRLDIFAPTHITVPTGSHIAIDYSDTASPSLAVRLQEMFGRPDTPTIADGAVPLTLHLLSPARRPVQVTRDLAGFWAGTYYDVRKDLRGRYPKHSWPDDPLKAEPTRRTRGHR
ncbi:MAG: ATP-dependent helicase HrpB [Longimicrobiales bacterium]